ncbi:hypothetical protein SAMN06295912_13414 [Sphingomonas laterariae]|uniref:Uncharacterized protein n=1 Tax=Edaphosphingomonas laterariae TaxID=861865 RepID=A0A239JFL9_9SPHN|nr:hypothetical protein [Sphingomonas laterariae]SNT04620.1 hypothetical protein SAMN06295912_13414 [Sphingomonas laterariae]
MPEQTTPQEQQAATRRRWLTLAELLGVAAVAISGLTLWDSHNDRVREREDKAAAAQKASTRSATLALRGTPDREGDVIALAPLGETQAIQGQTIILPTALAIAPVETTGDPRIEADWLADGLKRARRETGAPDRSVGDERLPILIVTRYLADGTLHEDRALYDLGYALDGQFLGSSRLRIRGLSLVARISAANGSAKLDARWRQLHPKAKPKP